MVPGSGGRISRGSHVPATLGGVDESKVSTACTQQLTSPEFAFDFGWFDIEPREDKRLTKIDEFTVWTIDVASGFTPRVVDSAPPVVVSIAAGSEVCWIFQGMDVVTAPDKGLRLFTRYGSHSLFMGEEKVGQGTCLYRLSEIWIPVSHD